MMKQSNVMCGGLRARRWVPVSAACLASALAACSQAPAAQPAGERPPVPVEIVTLAPKPLEQTGDFVGTIKSRRSTTIQSQAEGFLTAILVKSGDRVRAGTPLFEIDATTQQAAVASLESVRTAREAEAVWARQQADRAKKLLSAGAWSQQEYDQAMAQQKAAEAQLKAVEEQIRQQRAELAFHRVTAPAEGVVGDIPVRAGDRVTRSTVLTTVDDNTGLEVYVNVPVQEAPKLKLGLAVRLMSETGEVLLTERVSFIAPSVNDDTQTVLVKTPLEGRAGQFRGDQFIRARIVWSVAPGLTVPIVAINRINGVYFAFVAQPGERGGLVARQRQVTVGPVLGNDYVVLGGLSAGDRLIVSGVQKIGDGVPVVAAPPAGAARGGPAPGRGGE